MCVSAAYLIFSPRFAQTGNLYNLFHAKPSVWTDTMIGRGRMKLPSTVNHQEVHGGVELAGFAQKIQWLERSRPIEDYPWLV